MEKSIKNVWSKGFLNSEELKAPMINNLYNQKSTLTIEKIKKTYTLDMKFGVILMTLIVIAFFISSLYITALYTTMAFTLLYFYNKSILKIFEKINITTNSYVYLVTYRNKFRKSIKKVSLFMGIIFPLVCIIGYYISYKEAGIIFKFLTKLEPLNTFSKLLILYISLGIIMLSSYLLSVKILYGASLKKIDDIIADMEELRA